MLFLQNRTHRAGAQTGLARLLRHEAMRKWNPVLVCSRGGWLVSESARLGIAAIEEDFPARALCPRGSTAMRRSFGAVAVTSKTESYQLISGSDRKWRREFHSLFSTERWSWDGSSPKVRSSRDFSCPYSFNSNRCSQIGNLCEFLRRCEVYRLQSDYFIVFGLGCRVMELALGDWRRALEHQLRMAMIKQSH